VDGDLVLRFFAAIALIGLGLYAFAAIAKRGGFRPGSFLQRERLVEVIETTPLPRAGSLHVVKVAEAYFVIGRTDTGISLLSEIPKDAIRRAMPQRR
jgi:flagellar biogenesis protein FliO